MLAEILLAQGDATAADVLLRGVKADHGSLGWTHRLWKLDLLASTLIAERKLPEAADVLRDADKQLGAKRHLGRIRVAIAAGRLLAAQGKVGLAVAKLKATLQDAAMLGHVLLQFAARLALGQAELLTTNPSQGAERLAAPAADATATGYLQIARAASASHGSP